MTKTAIALAFALAFSAVSTASAEYDPWVMPSDSAIGYATTDAGYRAFASAEVPQRDVRFNDRSSGALW